MTSLRFRISRVSDRLSDVLSDGRSGLRLWHAAVAAAFLVLVGTAVIIARGDASQEVAEEAQVLSWSESVASSTAVLRGEVREGLVIAQSASRGVFDQAAVDAAVERIRDAATELEERAGVLVDLTNAGPIEEIATSVVAHSRGVARSLEGGEAGEAIELAETQLAPAVEGLSVETTDMSQASASHIAAVTAGVGTITTAARFVSALLIPVLAVFVLYRAMRRSKATSLLRSELARERELRHKKDAFIAAASHHIRTPLASVLGFSELLRDQSRDFSAGVRNEVTELLAIEAEETANVVDDLLAAARYDLGELHLEEVELEVRDVIDAATSDWAATQRMKLTISGNAVVVGDQRWLVHAIRNLLRNAASFGGEQITVEIRSLMNRVVVEIADNGEPVPANERDRIFELYYSYRQIEGLAPALGLGLSVARRIARAMGGDLDYYRASGENKFELRLPGAASSGQIVEAPTRTIDPGEGVPGVESIRQVLAVGGPDIVYQPIVELGRSGRDPLRVVGYEALARFEFGTPPQWFDAASAVDLRLDLELACISRAVDGFDPPERDAFLAVNVSDRTLHTSRLGEAIEGMEHRKLVLELSEAASIKSYEESRHVVDALAARGVRLAIDDVGSNDVDLWHLTRLGAHMIKVDMSLVRELRDTPRSRAMVKGIVAMSEELGLLVVAEGVEDEQEQALLSDLGVQFGQGFLFGRPEALAKAGADDAATAYRAS